MPELPDVEAIRTRLAEKAAGREIADVEVRDDEALKHGSPDALRDATAGHALSDITRHGKVLFARAGDGPLLAVHFGMTGDLAIVPGDNELPEHARVVFTFSDGDRLVFDNPRTFGWIDLADGIDAYLDENDIGPDALSISKDDFIAIVGGTRGQVKPALMDQSKLAGIGNVCSDEILFRAGIRPDTKGTDLSRSRLGDLFAAMQDVLHTASDRLSSGKDLPDDWLARHRDKGEDCPRCGGDLEHRKISGRTAWFCPKCQKGADK